MSNSSKELFEKIHGTNGNGKTASNPQATQRPKLIPKADLIQQLGTTEAEFDAHCKEWSVVVEAEYSSSQVAWFRERFGNPQPQPEKGAIAPMDIQQATSESLDLTVAAKAEALQQSAADARRLANEEDGVFLASYAQQKLANAQMKRQLLQRFRDVKDEALSTVAVDSQPIDADEVFANFLPSGYTPKLPSA